MESLRDSLDKHQKTVTMTSSQIDFLMRLNARAQKMFDDFKEMIAGEYLHQLAVDEFGMDPTKDFSFQFHPELEADNFTIIEKAPRK